MNCNYGARHIYINNIFTKLLFAALSTVTLQSSPLNPFEGDKVALTCSVPETDSGVSSWKIFKGMFIMVYIIVFVPNLLISNFKQHF